MSAWAKSTPDSQTCWICKRVKTRRTYRHADVEPRHAYLCGHCDHPEPS